MLITRVAAKLLVFCGATREAGTESRPGVQQSTDRTSKATSVRVTVHCRPDARARQHVTFGLPFTRGILVGRAVVRLTTPHGVRHTSDKTELVRCKHLSRSELDGISLRAMLIWFRHECGAARRASYLLHGRKPRRPDSGVTVPPGQYFCTVRKRTGRNSNTGGRGLPGCPHS